MPDRELLIEHERSGRNGTLAVSVKLDGELIHADKLDPSRAATRKRFAQAVHDKCTDVSAEAVEAELLAICEQVSEAKRPPAVGVAELDPSLIRRPELFFSASVCGVAVPIITAQNGQPAGAWAMFLRWADGRREARPLSSTLDLPDGRQLLLTPQPTAPSIEQAPGWSALCRREWLNGAQAPTAADLFNELRATIDYFLEFPEEHAAGHIATLTLWVVLSYSYALFDAVSYLSVNGPLGSGKTRVFDVLLRLAFRPLSAANMTAPTLFRTLDDVGGVLLLDEAERLRDQTPDANELRSILLSGYKRGAPARRLEPTADGKYKARMFNVFGLKAIAGIAGLPEALASRCIRITMMRAAKGSPKPKRLLDDDSDRWVKLRDDLHMFTLEHGQEWLSLPLNRDVGRDLANRDHEVWFPLLSLAAWFTEHGVPDLLQLIEDHAQALVELHRDDSTPDADEALLKIVADAVLAGVNASLTPAKVLKSAQERDLHLFNKWSTRGVVNTLGRYGVVSVKSHGERTYRDVTVAQLVRIEQVYSLDLGIPDESRILGGVPF